MTRDEAISEACLVVQGRATRCAGSNLRIHEDCKKVVVHDFSNAHLCEFEWQEPRRIPPNGTPVMWQPDGMGNHVGICTGESSPCGRPVVKMPHLKSSEETWACENWIELVEATP